MHYDTEFNQDILICGVGGQGTVLASKLIASAAMNEQHIVHSAETIGMAQRGGSVTSHVRIGKGAFSPLIPEGSANLMLAFEPAEAVRNLRYLKKDGMVIVSSAPVKPTTESLHDTNYDGVEMLEYLQKKCRCLVIDAPKICASFGSMRYLNMVILGAAAGAEALCIQTNTLREEIQKKVPAQTADTNIKAFLEGVNLTHGKS